VPAKVAIVLFNLGGPDRPEAIKPFLVNLFTDPAILRVPFFVRPFLARAIARRRLEPAQANYAILGGRSPLLELTQQQGVALQAALPDLDARCFIAMRYWHPFSDEAARAVRDWQPDEVVLLPLYPQYSTTTTGLLAHENTHKHLLSPQSAEDWEFNFPSPPLSAVPTEGGGRGRAANDPTGAALTCAARCPARSEPDRSARWTQTGCRAPRPTPHQSTIRRFNGGVICQDLLVEPANRVAEMTQWLVPRALPWWPKLTTTAQVRLSWPEAARTTAPRRRCS
jgi:hypothetical protein